MYSLDIDTYQTMSRYHLLHLPMTHAYVSFAKLNFWTAHTEPRKSLQHSSVKL